MIQEKSSSWNICGFPEKGHSTADGGGVHVSGAMAVTYFSFQRGHFLVPLLELKSLHAQLGLSLWLESVLHAWWLEWEGRRGCWGVNQAETKQSSSGP